MAGPNTEAERAALAGAAPNHNIATKHLGHPFADRQAQAGAAETATGRTIHLGKWPEQQAHLFLRHADARVDHVEDQLGLTLGSGIQPHDDPDTANFGELDGIADEIDEDLPQTDRIGRDRLGNVSPDLKRQRQSLCIRTHLHQGNDFGGNLAGRAFLEINRAFSRLDLR